MVGLNIGGDVLTLDERRTEQNERVRRTGDVPRAFPATRLGVIVGKRFFLRREDVGG